MNDTTTTAKVMHYGRRSCQVARQLAYYTGETIYQRENLVRFCSRRYLRRGGYVSTRNDFKIHQVPKTLQKPHTA